MFLIGCSDPLYTDIGPDPWDSGVVFVKKTVGPEMVGCFVAHWDCNNHHGTFFSPGEIAERCGLTQMDEHIVEDYFRGIAGQDTFICWENPPFCASAPSMCR